MGASHRCAAFAYDVPCIIGNYLNACVKASETISLADLGGIILESFKYLREKLSHIRYVGRPLPPYLGTLLLTRDTKRAAAARHVRETAPVPANGGTDGGSILGTVKGSGGVTPGQLLIPENGAPNTNPLLIQRLRLLLG